jgi:tRNA pseudouridine38-40 synthase
MGIEYDGREFAGWAKQSHARTVQGDLERMLGHLTYGHVDLTCAGRTDAGVHARGQVSHFDVTPERYERMLTCREPVNAARINRAISDDIRVTSLEIAPEGFDARFSALWRRYSYRVCDNPLGPTPLMRDVTLPWYRALDLDRMNEAALPLLGQQDFTPFCKPREGATNIRELQILRWDRSPEGDAIMTIQADAFCHSMGRHLVGALLPVGDRRRDVSWVGEILGSGRKNAAVAAMAPHPLVLEEVGYPADDELQARQDLTRARRSLGEESAEGSPDGSGD